MMNIKLISFMDAAIREQLTKIGKEQYIQDGVDFNSIVYNIYKRYLGLIRDEETVYDILLEAFSELFIRKIDKAFSNYNGVYNGAEISLEFYVKKLFSREVIKISKRNTEEFKRRTSVNPIEEESSENAFDRTAMGGSTLKIVDNSEEVKYLREIVSQYKDRYDRITSDELKVTNKEVSLGSLEHKIKRMNKQIASLVDDKQLSINRLTVKLNSFQSIQNELEEGLKSNSDDRIKIEIKQLQLDCEKIIKQIDVLERSKFRVNSPEEDSIPTVEEEIAYTSYTGLIKTEMNRKGFDELDNHIFNMLSDGFLQIEIAEYFGIPRNDVSKRVKKLKLLVQEVAEEQADWYDDNSLLKQLQNITENGTTTNSRNVLNRSTKELYIQVHNLYGKELTY